jgi:hypothetical protein
MGSPARLAPVMVSGLQKVIGLSFIWTVVAFEAAFSRGFSGPAALAILAIKTIPTSSISFIIFIFAHRKHKAFLKSVQRQIASRVSLSNSDTRLCNPTGKYISIFGAILLRKYSFAQFCLFSRKEAVVHYPGSGNSRVAAKTHPIGNIAPIDEAPIALRHLVYPGCFRL